MKVKECMCDESFCVKPETSICEVAKIMANNHVGSVAVCDNNNCLCGIVTDRDIILRSIACDKDVHQTPVSSIMSTDVFTCKKDDDVKDAERTMAQKQVRTLPVCDENRNVIGFLSIGDLAQNDQLLGKQNVCETISDICDCNVQAKNAE